MAKTGVVEQDSPENGAEGERSTVMYDAWGMSKSVSVRDRGSEARRYEVPRECPIMGQRGIRLGVREESERGDQGCLRVTVSHSRAHPLLERLLTAPLPWDPNCRAKH